MLERLKFLVKIILRNRYFDHLFTMIKASSTKIANKKRRKQKFMLYLLKPI